MNNTIINNDEIGVRLNGCDHSMLTNNLIASNGERGIYLDVGKEDKAVILNGSWNPAELMTLIQDKVHKWVQKR